MFLPLQADLLHVAEEEINQRVNTAHDEASCNTGHSESMKRHASLVNVCRSYRVDTYQQTILAL